MRYSIVVKDSGEEDKVWFMSRETLQDVKGYLQVKKAAGAAMEMRLEDEEGSVPHPHPPRIEMALRSPSARQTMKRTGTPENDNEETQKPKRRRSWPEIDAYAPEPHAGSPLCSG